ncbi:NAD(P)-dependent oxidoreductase [Streptomyces corynorhini]|uniref:NAD(P)-dependent oxidoreductase n=1 Tax=Streptomyces corynorhini TaxID=2282652 RepID=A0A370BJ86_9ACTN|nr:NAD(P)-binding domain-containing protein [Streptomyces corynorhini]RDG39833.1 NAD(P)-dependent oxidoreductase [Streptomyces corynorhini]
MNTPSPAHAEPPRPGEQPPPGGADPRPVTVIGLGLMGSALASAFLRAGHPTTVWNRSPQKADPLVASGAVRAASVADAVAAAPLVVVCVTRHDAVVDVLDAGRTALPGRVLVNLTSGSSREARALADRVAALGAHCLDGAILTTPDAIGAPDATVLYGGPDAVFRAHAPTLAALGGGVTFLGADPGIPSLYEVALLDIMWTSLTGVLHAMALVGTEGIAATEFAPFAAMLYSGVGSFVPRYARQIADGAYPADDSTLHTHLAGIRHLTEESGDRAVEARLPLYIQGLMERAVARGQGGDSFARLVEQFAPPAQGAASAATSAPRSASA